MATRQNPVGFIEGVLVGEVGLGVGSGVGGAGEKRIDIIQINVVICYCTSRDKVTQNFLPGATGTGARVGSGDIVGSGTTGGCSQPATTTPRQSIRHSSCFGVER